MYAYREIDDHQLRRFTELVCEFPVSHTWASAVKPAVFLELGALRPCPRTGSPSGQICMMIETDWNMRQGARVVGGSRFDDAALEASLQSLVGQHVVEIAIRETSKELTVYFGDGRCFETLTTWEHDAPAWHISLKDKDVISRIAPSWDGIDASFALCVDKESYLVGIGYSYNEDTVKPGVEINDILL